MPIDVSVLRPAILIGMGGVGAEVVIGVRDRLIAMTRNDPDAYAELVDNRFQFLTVDTSRFQMSRDLVGRGVVHYGIPYEGNTEDLVNRLRATDRQFVEWWHPNFVPADLTFGAGMVPANGRLCWMMDRRGAETLRLAVERAANAANNLLSNNLALGSYWIYLVGSVAGGTGAGIMLPLMYQFHNFHPQRTRLVGVFMLPSAVQRRPIKVGQIQQLWANGAATLLSLDYWLAPTGLRPFKTEPFFGSDGHPALTLQGDTSPLHAAFVFSNRNRNGMTMASYKEYTALMADGLAEMLFAQSVGQQIQDLNNYVQSVRNRTSWGGRSQIYGSFGVARMRYPADRVTAYLSHKLGQALLRNVLLCPYTAPGAEEDVRRFLQDNRLRELNPHNDLMQVLKEPRRDMHVQAVPDMAALLEPAKEGTVADIVRNAVSRAMIALGLIEPPKGSENRGPTFKDMLAENAAQHMAAVRTALDKTIEGLMAGRDTGLQHAGQWVVDVAQQLSAHAAEIKRELEGNVARDPRDIGMTAREEALRQVELEKEIAELVAEYRRWAFNRSVAAAKRRFLERWWQAWVEIAKGVLVRKQILQFYGELDKVLRAYDYAFKKVVGIMAELSEEWTADAVKALATRHIDETTVTAVEELVLATPALIDQRFPMPAVPDDVSGAATALASQGEHNLLSIVRRLHALELEGERQDAEAVAAVAKEPLAGRILDWARDRFEKSVDAVSIWEALAWEEGARPNADGSPLSPDQLLTLTTALGGRLSACQQRCAAFWETSPSAVAGAQPVLAPAVVQSLTTYNPEAWEAFRARYGIRQAVPPQLDNEGMPVPDPHSISFVEVQGGWPLYVLQEADQMVAQLKAYQLVGGAAPAFSDRRLGQKLSLDWKPYRRDDERVLFILGEELGVIASPLKKAPAAAEAPAGGAQAKRRTTASRTAYRLVDSDQALSTSRYEAQRLLAENATLRGELVEGLQREWRRLSGEQQDERLQAMRVFLKKEAPKHGGQETKRSIDRLMEDPDTARDLGHYEREPYAVLRRDALAAADLTAAQITRILTPQE